MFQKQALMFYCIGFQEPSVIDKRTALVATCVACVSQPSTQLSAFASLPWMNIKLVDHTTNSELFTLEEPSSLCVDHANRASFASK